MPQNGQDCLPPGLFFGQQTMQVINSRDSVTVQGDNNVAIVDLKTLTLVDRLQTGVGPDGMAWIK